MWQNSNVILWYKPKNKGLGFMNSHDDELENLLHEWGAWARNGFKLERGHSIAYEMTQIAPCDKAKLTINSGCEMRIKRRKKELEELYSDLENKQRLINQALNAELDTHRLYKTGGQSQTRSRKINIPDNSKLENVDKILSTVDVATKKKEDRIYKKTLILCYQIYPNIGRKSQAVYLKISTCGLDKRLLKIKNHLRDGLTINTQ